MVSHIELPSLDHIPIFFRLARPDKPAPLSRGRPFRFEAMWIHKDECEEIIHTVWRTLEDLVRLLWCYSMARCVELSLYNGVKICNQIDS